MDTYRQRDRNRQRSTEKRPTLETERDKQGLIETDRHRHRESKIDSQSFKKSLLYGGGASGVADLRRLWAPEPTDAWVVSGGHEPFDLCSGCPNLFMSTLKCYSFCVYEHFEMLLLLWLWTLWHVTPFVIMNTLKCYLFCEITFSIKFILFI